MHMKKRAEMYFSPLLKRTLQTGPAKGTCPVCLEGDQTIAAAPMATMIMSPKES